jgi:hypothetical protein
MSQKKLSIGIAVLLAVMYVLGACNTGTGSSSTETPTYPESTPSTNRPVQTPAQKAATTDQVLKNSGFSGTRQNGATIILSMTGSDNVPTTPVSIPSDVTLEIPNGATYGSATVPITIEAGATLVDNKVRNASDPYLFGGLTGNLTVANGATVQVNAGSSPGSELRTLVGRPGDTTAFFTMSKPGDSINFSVVSGVSTITVNGPGVELNSPTYGSKRTINLANNEKVVIKSGATLTLNGNLNIDDTGGEIEIETNGTLVINAGAHLQARQESNIISNSSGQIIVKKNGSIFHFNVAANPGSDDQSLIIDSTGDNSKTLYIWDNSALDTAEFIVDFGTLTITKPASGVNNGSGAVTTTTLGINTGWTFN